MAEADRQAGGLDAAQEQARAALIGLAPHDFLAFARGLVIPSARGPALYDLVMADFQRQFFESIAPALHAVRDGKMPPCRRFWLERTKKASKDTDVAVIVLWLMSFPIRPFLGQIAAANRGQAGIIEERCHEILFCNPWLNEHVDIVRNTIRTKKRDKLHWRNVRTRIEATGSAGAAQGPTPDLLVLNELVHVDKWDVMKAHMANLAGVPQGVGIVATNAGIRGTEAEVWRKNALAPSSGWSSHIFSGVAPWLSPQDIEDAKRMDPIGNEFARLYRGVWVSGSGDAVSPAELDKVFREDGPLSEPASGWQFVAGLDLGVSKDHAGVAVVGVNESLRQIRVARVKGWEPSLPVEQSDGSTKLEVDGDDVERTLDAYCRLYRVEACMYDPAAGGSFMAQRLRKRGVPMVEMTFSSPSNLTDMATAYVQSVKEGVLTSHEDDDGRLRRDFGKFRISYRAPSRYRLEAVSDEFGHADVGTAVVVCLPRAVDLLGGLRSARYDFDLIADDDTPLTDEELSSMPDELAELIGDDDDDLYRSRSRSRRPRRSLDDDYLGLD